MGYLFWDTERIRSTKIYMMAYILTDEAFNVLDKETVIDSSVDVSKRHKPRQKVEKLKKDSLIMNSFENIMEKLKPLIENNKVVCFGKDDFVALNDQLKVHNLEIIKGNFYNIQHPSEEKDGLMQHLSEISSSLNIEHDKHNPISDSYVTMEYFKYLVKTHDESDFIQPIPNVSKILDTEANGIVAQKEEEYLRNHKKYTT